MFCSYSRQDGMNIVLLFFKFCRCSIVKWGRQTKGWIWLLRLIPYPLIKQYEIFLFRRVSSLFCGLFDGNTAYSGMRLIFTTCFSNNGSSRTLREAIFVVKIPTGELPLDQQDYHRSQFTKHWRQFERFNFMYFRQATQYIVSFTFIVIRTLYVNISGSAADDFLTEIVWDEGYNADVTRNPT